MNERAYNHPHDALVTAVATAAARNLAAPTPATSAGPTVEEGTAVYCFLTQLFTGATQIVFHVS